MPKSSSKPGKGGYRFASAGSAEDAALPRLTYSDTRMSVSLKYYRQETERFSEWPQRDLKKFDATIAKLRDMTASALIGHGICTRHKQTVNSGRFVRPDGISADLQMFEIRVDTHNQARMHGIIAGSIFHLVWLDRKHEVFP